MDDLRPQLQVITELARNGELQQAILEVDRLIAEHPTDSDAAYTRARLILNHGTPFDAVNATSEYCRKFPKSQDGRVLLAGAHLGNRDPKRALDEIERAEAMCSPTPYTRAAKAKALIAMGLKEEAKALAEEGLDMPGNNLMAVSLHQQLGGEMSEARMLEYVAASRAAGTRETDISIFEADWYLALGQIDHARTALERALVDSPHNSALNYGLGICEFRSGNQKSGLRRIRKTFDADPYHSASAIWLMGYYKRRFNIIGMLYVSFRHFLALIRIKPTPG